MVFNRIAGVLRFMNTLTNYLIILTDFAWGPVMAALILGVGIYLSFGLRGISVTRIPEALCLLASSRSRSGARGDGEISPWAALMTAMSGAVGVGNIAGVATAIHLGGPGAVFWMWMTALVGMATKYSECFLAVTFREKHGAEYVGGPMYYIKLGLGSKWAWLGALYAVFASIAALGAGSTVQANSVADALQAQFDVPRWVSALILMIATFSVVIGGLKRLARTAEVLVPAMIGLFVSGGLIVLAARAPEIPGALALIVNSAFSPTAPIGGLVGGGIALAMRYGIARGIFSNESGLGTAAIMQAAVRNDDVVKLSAIGMLGTFIDTLVVNSVTGLAIITTGIYLSGGTGAPLTAQAFQSVLGEAGGVIVSVSLVLFAFTTIVSWCVYGERCAAYLWGPKVVVPYRYLWCLFVPIGAVAKLELVWLATDLMNALMALPNLIALILLSPIVFSQTRKRLCGGQPLLIQATPHTRPMEP